MRKFIIALLMIIITLSTTTAILGCGENQQFMVNFNDQTKTIARVETKGEEKIRLPKAPVRIGYEFDGWHYNERSHDPVDSDGEYVNIDWKLNSDVNIYCHYVEIGFTALTKSSTDWKELSATVAYNVNTFSFVGEFINMKNFYIAYDAQGVQKCEGNTVNVVAGDNIFYVFRNDYEEAVFNVNIHRDNVYTVQFKNGSSIVSTQMVAEGDLLYEPNVEIKKLGCNLSWNYDFTLPITKNTVVSAVWTPIDELLPFEFTSTDTTLTITGIKDKTIKKIEIPECVTEIGKEAFADCSYLRTVIIGKNVRNINSDAFLRCQKLYEVYDLTPFVEIVIGSINNGRVGYYAGVIHNSKNEDSVFIDAGDFTLVNKNGVATIVEYLGTDTQITLPSTATAIEKYAFSNNKQITSLTIPNSVIKIGDYAFENMLNLTSVTIGSGVTAFGNNAFVGCSKIATVNYLGNVDSWCAIEFYNENANPVSISKSLKINEENVTSITISNSVEKINKYAFKNLKGLTSVTIPASVTSVGEEAFMNCVNLQTAEINAKVINTKAFSECTSISNLSIGDNVMSIGNYAFLRCAKLTELTLGDNLKNIGNGAFSLATKLTSLNVGNGVETIGAEAFNSAKSLSKVVLGTALKSIGSSAFYNCYKLTEVYNLSSINVKIGNSNNGYVAYYAGVIHTSLDQPSTLSKDANGLVTYMVAGEKHLAYYEGNSTQIVIPSDIKSIKKYAFVDSLITKVTIPSSVKVIGENAFDNCAKLETVTFQADSELEAIEFAAFYGCEKLNNVTIPNSVKLIDDSAFACCKSIKKIVIPNSVTVLGGNSFRDCSSLQEITLGSGVTQMGRDAFGDCENLTTLYYVGNAHTWCNIEFDVASANPLSLVDTVYFDGKLFTSIEIPNTVEKINKYAFYDYDALTSVTLPNSIASIGEEAFYGCDALERITIPDSVAIIEKRAFQHCNGLIDVQIDNGEVQELAFSYCTNLISLTMNAGTILDQAFANCVNLRTITLNGVTEIGSHAFLNCYNVYSVVLPSTLEKVGLSYPFNDGAKLTEVYNLSNFNINTFVDWTIGAIPFIHTSIVEQSVLTTDNGFVTYKTGDDVVLVDYQGDIAEVVIPQGVTIIGEYAFYRNEKIKKVTVHDEVVKIGDYAFSKCKNLLEVVIGKGVTEIKSGAFYDSNKIKVVYNLSSIDISNWFNPSTIIKTSLSELIPFVNNNGVITCSLNGTENILVCYDNVGGKAYQLTLPNGVNVIGDNVFYQDDKITAITLGQNTTRISSYAFYGCVNLTTVNLKNVEQIYSHAFSGCTGLTTITLPKTITDIGYGALSGCKNLTEIRYEGTVEQWNSVEWRFNNQWATGSATTKVICSDGEVAI